MDMKHTFFRKMAICSLSAAFLFGFSACDSRQQGAIEDDGLINEETGLEEGGLAENEVTAVADRSFYAEWDADRSGELNTDEFRERWQASFADQEYDEDLFSEWDLNANAGLDENEFRSGVWNFYNKDRNTGLDMDEYRGFDNTYFFARWDADNNNTIAQTEFREGWNNYMGERELDESLFNSWDVNRDAVLDENEYATGMFGYWDENKSGILEETEYNTFYR